MLRDIKPDRRGVLRRRISCPGRANWGHCCIEETQARRGEEWFPDNGTQGNLRAHDLSARERCQNTGGGGWRNLNQVRVGILFSARIMVYKSQSFPIPTNLLWL